MEKTEETLVKIQEIFRKELKNEDLVLSLETSAKDINGWDSLTHVVLIVAVESAFKKRFHSREIQNWKNIGDMVSAILEAKK